MADSTQFLSHSSSIEHGMSASNPAVSIEAFIESQLGTFGRIQLIQAVLVSLIMFFDGQQAFISVFTDAEPAWHCTNSNLPCSSTSNICHLPKDSWAWSDEPPHKTIISEWDLECSSAFVTGLPASSFYMGSLLGGFVIAFLVGDSALGRKNLLFLSCFTMSVTAAATVFLSSGIFIYSGLRFFTGFCRVSIMSSALVLLVERVGNKRRGQVGIIGFLCFSLGLLSLPAIAYANRSNSWRSMYLWTSVPAILYCIIAYSFVHDSPRWLFLRGYKAEAMDVVNKLSSVSANFPRIEPKGEVIILEEANTTTHSSVIDLFRRKRDLRRLLGVVAIGFGVGMVYYGLLLGVENLHFNIYLSVTFNGLVDIPAYLVTFILIERCSRRRSIFGFCVLSGILCILCVVVGDEQRVLKLGFELASFFSVCVAFNVMLIYTTELFPTVVRNWTTAMVRQSIYFGAAFGPMLASAGTRSGDGSLQYWVFGVVVMCCGTIVIYLPETFGATFSDSFDEQEQNDAII